MNKLISTSIIASSLLFSAGANAALIGSGNLQGGFSLTGFSPIVDTDSNPFTYTLTGTNLVGSVSFDIPAGTLSNVQASGTFTADAGSLSVLPPISLSNVAIDPTAVTGISPGQFMYDFTNQSYTTTSGNFNIFLGTLPGSVLGLPFGLPLSSDVNVQYNILALDLDGIMNDIVINFTETPTPPLFSIAQVINTLDMLPTSGQPGIIDGTFSTEFQVTANVSNVTEPMTLSLFGLGLLGLAFRRRQA